MDSASRLWVRLHRSAFVRNVLIVMSGTAAAQLLGLVCAPIISRLYLPADFGIFGSFSAVLVVLTAGVTLEYTQAILLPKSTGDAINLLALSCLAALVISAVCLLVMLAAPSLVQALFQAKNPWLTLLLAVGLVAGGLNKALQAWCIRVKAFRRTSASQVIRSLCSNGLQIGIGVGPGGALGLVVASVLADLLASVNLALRVRTDVRDNRCELRWQRLAALAAEYRDFPLYSASMEVMNALSRGLPVVLLSYFFGLAVGGAYAFGVRILMTPMNLVQRSLRQVLFQKACETHQNGGRLLPLYRRVTLGLFAMAALPCVVLAVWGVPLFMVVFGPAWELAGTFARCLSFWLAFMFCNVPSVLFARIIRIQRRLFFYEVAMLAGRTLVLVGGGLRLSPTWTVLLFALFGGCMNLFLILLVGRSIRGRESSADFSANPEA